MPPLNEGEIHNRRERIKQNIRQLNRKHTSDARELERILKEIVNLSAQDMRYAIVEILIECFDRMVERTPVATGRARAGWYVTINGDLEWKPAENLPPSEYRAMLEDNIKDADIPDSGNFTVHVINNLDYILALNAGWSKQQAGNFIDLFMLEMKQKLAEYAAQNR